MLQYNMQLAIKQYGFYEYCIKLLPITLLIVIIVHGCIPQTLYCILHFSNCTFQIASYFK